MKKYKYIHISQTNQQMHRGKPVYRIFNNRTKAELGLIFWEAKWKEFVFTQATEGCIFNNGCLRDIVDFLENHTQS